MKRREFLGLSALTLAISAGPAAMLMATEAACAGPTSLQYVGESDPEANAVRDALLALDGVKDAYVTKGRDENSIRVYVVGGRPTDIFRCIFMWKTWGTALEGSSHGEVQMGGLGLYHHSAYTPARYIVRDYDGAYIKPVHIDSV